MAHNSDVIEEESFIILGTSPGTSLDLKCNGLVSDGPLDKAQLEDAMKDLSAEASMAFKAHFKLGDCPSPASLMVASNIISEDKSTEELQKRFGEILDENVLLKETLKQNNDSMKDQFLLIASCQEDMMKTHSLHKEKFEETKELVERLRQENKKLKQDIVRLSESSVNGVNTETGEAASGPPSAVEFVTSPDDDTVNKLTAQLELVEKQRRQVIVDNEKLTWQKESLEHIVDATSKERDDLKEKLKNVELQLSCKDSDYAVEINRLKSTIQSLQSKLQSSSSITSLSTEEIRKRDASIQQLEGKLSALQNDYKTSQLKVLELESVKLEFTKHKSGTAEIIRIYKDQIQDLQNRLKDAQITLFQPVRLSLTPDTETQSSEFSSYLANVKLYDRTLKHLAELLNNLAHSTSDNLVQILGVVASLHDYKLERASADQVKAGLADVKQQLEAQYKSALNNIGQVRSTMTIFEGIFKDYNELLKKAVTLQSKPTQGANVEALTAALLARGQEVSALTLEMRQLRVQQEEVDVLKAQLDLYKSDFEAEREAREKMAAEKENILTDLRTTQRRNQELIQHIQQSPVGPASAAQSPPSAVPRQPTTVPRQPTTVPHQPTTVPRQPTAGPRQPTAASPPAASQGNTTGNIVQKKTLTRTVYKPPERESTPPPPRFDCPVCDRTFRTLPLLQHHVDSCLL
ncbi:NF-kappa-B essential modulator kenny isoform X1 [Choristoneura fumiferana]|uniref:NF-kappa-B essential modulator kenny isoform X1 n=1 Tax=Choristoneura fumiferana TaxID=7141 RepID=UPI003D15BE6B